ncbi:MAG: type II/IV secretion system ATPase subunit [Methanoregulaceae archaeon]|nr:type II/IV secretion system ATPase subunit [Methanoregulaceae archaeon]
MGNTTKNEKKEPGFFKRLIKSGKEADPPPIKRKPLPDIDQEIENLADLIGRTNDEGNKEGVVSDLVLKESPPGSVPAGPETRILSPETTKTVQVSKENQDEPAGTKSVLMPGIGPKEIVVARKIPKAQWSESGPEPDEHIVNVDQVKDLSGLILPKGATFQVDEVKLHKPSANLASSAVIPAEMDEIWKKGLPTGGVKDINLDTEEAGTAGKEGVFKKFSLSKIIHHKAEEYDPRIHGPLVDLTFRPRPGVEELEVYPVNEPFAYVRITYDHNSHESTYEVLEPVLSPAELDLLSELKERIFERLDINSRDIVPEFAKTTLRQVTDEIIADYGLTLTPVQHQKILYNMYKEFLGQGLIDPVMHDKYIEDISCDGVNCIIFVYHSRFESMKTNIMFTEAQDLDSYVTKLAQRAGKYISIAEPMLDATMSDGSRIQMTLGQEVTAHGSTFTVRKFREEPITPTDLIDWGTFSPLSIAFLWLAIEAGKSCIFAGGTASGKTTSLNAVSLFIPPLAKIVTLEDTRELKLPHSNWIPSVTRASFDTEGKGEIDMYELLKAALRQRPEYILVGEVRGREALTLFQAMSTGHVTYSTIHADSVASMVHRLENPPLDVPRNMLSALDLVSVQVQVRVGGQRIRRNKQIIEILDIDPRTNELITNEVFRWRQVSDEISYSGKSFILEEIMEARGWNEDRVREELKRRQEVLEWMRLKKIRHFRDVSKILVSYFRDPEAVITKVRTELYEQL